MKELPLMLAGPILRRVEPKLVAVWVALKEPCKVKLTVYQGLGTVSDLSKKDPVVESAETATIRIGKQLHILVITAHPKIALLPEKNYSYDITVTTQSEPSETKTLKTMNLLKDGKAVLKDGKIIGQDHIALGYTRNFLPSFALPPVKLTDLKILHGSCRRASKDIPDGLAWVDEFIQASQAKPNERPHQLFLAGDQIYADDVARPELKMLNEASKTLIGDKLDSSEDIIPIEKLPVAGKLWPADDTHFPPGHRLTLTHNEARFTSTSGHSHLLSFGEYCALYLFSWSNGCWPAVATDNLPKSADAASLPKAKDFLPPFPHEGLINPSLLMHLSPTGETREPGKRVLDQLELSDTEGVKERTEAIEHDLQVMKEFRRTLPKVRRALANVPTYMMFDDHDVTDDWYLNPMWRDRVLTSPLGKTIIRNGLVAYALFQGWGNDPETFKKGKHKELLDQATKLFPEGATDGPNEKAGDTIDTLLGLDGKDPPVTWHYTVPGAKHMVLALDNRTRRDYVSRVGPPSNLSAKAMKEQIPPGPLPLGLEVLIVVAPLPVLGPPVLDELLAPFVYRAYDLFAYQDLSKRSGSKDMPGTNPDAIEAWAFDPKTFESLLKRLEPYQRVVFLSGDVHYGASQSMSYWKKNATTPTRFAQFTSSGLRNTMPAKVRIADRSFAFAQRIIRADIGTERIGWNKTSPEPLLFDSNEEIVPALAKRLKQEPVMIPTQGWPKGTQLNSALVPDWQWRVEPIHDTRTDDKRPEPARPAKLVSGAPKADIQTDLVGYRDVVHRHVTQLQKLNNSRQILFANNLGLVKFENRNDILHAIHELYTTHPSASLPEKPDVYTLHVVALSNDGEEKPEEKFKPGARQ